MRKKIIPGALAVAGAGFLLALATALSASAHDELVDSTPAAGQTLTTLPTQFSVTSNADLLDLVGDGTGFGIRITDAAGAFYGDGCVTVAGPTVSTPAALGTAGAYTMVWQFVSGDGHPVSDTLSFTWAPDASFEPSVGVSTPPVCGVAAPAPEPTATIGPVPVPTMSISAGDDDAATSAVEDPAEGGTAPFWIGGGILVVLVAAASATYFLRRTGNATASGSGGEMGSAE